jgi:anion-transporting  ArsA/GET3 family ATPase|tara:strand:- start:120 stop:467 length:348 start_codon:yes stop_codon:yes gene_type:complete
MKILKRFWNWLLGKTVIDEYAVATVKETKKRLKAVKEEFAEAKEAISEAVEQVKDVFEAAQDNLIEGKVTKSKLNTIKKTTLIKHAKDEFGEEFDSKIAKSNLVNKVYSLYKARM